VLTDWSSEESLYAACIGVDVVIHAAGMNAQDSADDPVSALTINGVGSARLAIAAREAGVKRFLYFSTAHVYSSKLIGTILEDNCPTNTHPYASSHLAGEFALRHIGQTSELEVLILRMSNAFGAPKIIRSNCWGLLAQDLCRQIFEHKKMLLSTAGDQWRDFIPLTAVCEAVDKLIVIGTNLNTIGVLNLGGQAMRVIDMALLIQERARKLFNTVPPIVRPLSHNESKPEALDYCCERLERLIGEREINMVAEVDGLLRFCATTFEWQNNSV
jgi:UDP-glucose 4-epimerase